MSHNPDKWLVIDCRDDQGSFQKLFATWAGGYISGDSWRLNSGITRVEIDPVDPLYLIFWGESGSSYRVHRDMQGVAGASNTYVLDSLLKKFEGKMTVVRDYHK